MSAPESDGSVPGRGPLANGGASDPGDPGDPGDPTDPGDDDGRAGLWAARPESWSEPPLHSLLEEQHERLCSAATPGGRATTLDGERPARVPGEQRPGRLAVVGRAGDRGSPTVGPATGAGWTSERPRRPGWPSERPRRPGWTDEQPVGKPTHERWRVRRVGAQDLAKPSPAPQPRGRSSRGARGADGLRFSWAYSSHRSPNRPSRRNPEST